MKLLSGLEPDPPNVGPGPSVECFQAWDDLNTTCETFLMAGLRHSVGPDGDLTAEYRRWHKEFMKDHDDMIFRMLKRIAQSEKYNAQ